MAFSSESGSPLSPRLCTLAERAAKGATIHHEGYRAQLELMHRCSSSISQQVHKVSMKETVCLCALQTSLITDLGVYKRLTKAEWIKERQRKENSNI